MAEAEFDVVFSNSAVQWFHDPAKALRNVRRALRPGGRLGLQAPATEAYCRNFLEAVRAATRDPCTRRYARGFRSPWFFLPDA